MNRTRFHQCSCLLALAAVVLLDAMPAHADGIIIRISSVSVVAGTNGAAFDVNIQNIGSSQNIAGFSLGLSVGDSHITFTGGDESTSLTYLFSGDSFDAINSFPYTTTPPPNGQTVEASDLSNSGLGTNEGTTTLGLGHIFFNIAADTPPEVINVTLVPNCSNSNSCTSLSDSSFASVPFTVVNGTITVTSSVPEPSTVLLALFGLPVVALRRRGL